MVCFYELNYKLKKNIQQVTQLFKIVIYYSYLNLR